MSYARTGTFYGTVAVVRDMVRILDAIGGDGLLRFHGASYGTVLGWTFAQMFPERVERMLLNGNVNNVEWWNGYEVARGKDTDKVFQNLLQGCVDSQGKCKLAELGDVDTIRSKLEAKLGSLTDGQAASFKAMIYNNLYHPSTWSEVVTKLYALIENGVLSKRELVKRELVKRELDRGDPVQCSDFRFRANTASELATLAQTQNPLDWFHFQQGSAWNCYAWQFDAVERFENAGRLPPAKTKNPVLLVNPTWDPVTPLANAHNNSLWLERSVVLEHRGNGHGTDDLQKSRCTYQAMRDYFVDLKMPDRGAVCDVDVQLFSDDNSMTVLKPLYEEAGFEVQDDGTLKYLSK
ncbi:uncharacterized protein AB675_900 [Cyphellophora attinorum]|uniref:Peptidase S33 tripeptidyl aminopeptidase-like C-terminal domain-containing protein n=1 Tax=Cyphellophora attinorum TaxID=1664694 RepID=A0A0N1P3L8_9EURO|nr:uncharacterized protein AB675_900 [Phialophora attinorum]KPI45623.1 hypothetical protein AB675_900 [Phialophora attinorum]